MRLRIRGHYPSIGECTIETVDPMTAIVSIRGIGQGADGHLTTADAKRALARAMRAAADDLESQATDHEKGLVP